MPTLEDKFDNKIQATEAIKFLIFGSVQGVGFRPFIYRLAREYNILGWIKNVSGYVEIFAQGHVKDLNSFQQSISSRAPALAEIWKIQCKTAKKLENIRNFSIADSEHSIDANTSTKDYVICDTCKTELFDKNNRRHLHPFINCTNCGPRFSIINNYPFDRSNTTYNEFKPCKKCEDEYNNCNNRRFHAQNINCPDCGPSIYSNSDSSINNQSFISQCCKALNAGKIVTLKSTGGYKLLCDATSASSISRLRELKHRPHKPFAVMFPDIETISNYTQATPADIRFISSKENPVLIVPKSSRKLSDNIHPGLSEIAVCLPGNAIELMLLHYFSRPVIYTSGNISNAPIISSTSMAEESLKCVADLIIHHNLEISQATDDSIWKSTNGAHTPIRLSKGYAPVSFELSNNNERTVIALGAQMKNTVAIAHNDLAIVSPHMGDHNDFRNWQRTLRYIQTQQKQLNVKNPHYLIDKHSTYTSHQWVIQQSLEHSTILHHHAHASAVATNIPTDKNLLIFTWDGTGLGENNNLWGGETLFGRPGQWQRLASIRPFPLIGAELAITKVWRCAASVLWEIGYSYEVDVGELQLTKQAWKNKTNSPMTTSIGRLFDAAAAILGLVNEVTYDGQAAMLLEAGAIEKTEDFISLPFHENSEDFLESDWAKLVVFLTDTKFSVPYRATVFHNSLAHLILNQCLTVRKKYGVNNIGLSGGVFQNTVLLGKTKNLLKKYDFNCYNSRHLPSNDAHICYGQLIEYFAQEHIIA